MSFSDKILEWYQQNKRNLPWRSTRVPYKIWLSEIILQQTRVAQGIPYYLKFLETFPTINDLANAPEEKVLKLWQGLGYYSRARNLHAAAKTIAYEYGGNFPSTYNDLIRLKGVGDYTASAISSICFNERQAVVDGNVYRVLARYFGVELPINETAGIKYFKDLAMEVLHRTNTRDYNQALMEFGAIQCTPKNPNCMHCPLNGGCVALRKNQVHLLPIKKGKTKVRKRFFNYLVPIAKSDGDEIITQLRQRTDRGIWRNLWQFPLLETESQAGLEDIHRRYLDIVDFTDVPTISRYNDEPIVHKLSHQHLYTTFWILEGGFGPVEGVKISKLEYYPVPVLIADFIKTFKF